MLGRDLPTTDRSTYFFQQNRQTDCGNKHMNRSETHECRNWDCGGCAIPFLGLRVSNFRYWFFVVCILKENTQY
jgi:hypothetical protein